MREIRIFPDRSSQADGAATLFVAAAARAIAADGCFSVALAGGSTPEGAYRRLASNPHLEEVDWSRVHIFWGDERCVAADDPQSNYRMARETLLERVPLPSGNIHRMAGERGPEAGARAYAAELAAFFGSRWPAFHLVLLGMGSDGHTASLFPKSQALQAQNRPVAGVAAGETGGSIARITLTDRAINTTGHAVFLVAGADKAATVQAVLEGPPDQYPAQRISPAPGRLTWLLDREAAHLLERAKWESEP
jgi:6-phosphogluconolactonase